MAFTVRRSGPRAYTHTRRLLPYDDLCDMGRSNFGDDMTIENGITVFESRDEFGRVPLETYEIYVMGEAGLWIVGRWLDGLVCACERRAMAVMLAGCVKGIPKNQNSDCPKCATIHQQGNRMRERR